MWYCHSTICRKLGGSAFATHVEAKPSGFRWLRGKGFIRRYEISTNYLRSFCGQCGSVLPYASPDGSRTILPAGGIDDDPGVNSDVRPFAHAFVAEKAPWHPITDDLPRFELYPPPGFDWRQGVNANKRGLTTAYSSPSE